MDVTVSIRVFSIDNPVESSVSAGAVALQDPENLNWEKPDQHGTAFEQYMHDEFESYLTEPPAPQAVYDDVVVVLEEILIDVLEDGIEYRFQVDIPENQAICVDRTDDETGLAAEQTMDDERIADGLQRSADAVSHRFNWVDVISPRSLMGVAEAAEEMFDMDEENGTK